ncbi:MAG: family B DNA polymerase [bacterium]
MNKWSKGYLKFANNFENKDKFRDSWIKDVSRKLEIEDNTKLYGLFKDNFVNRDITLINTVRGKTYKIPALDFISDVYSKPYLMVENGTFFLNQDVITPPVVKGEMQLFEDRAEIKKLGNYYLTEGDNPILGKLYDLRQKDTKVVMNTLYGVLINMYCKLFSPDLGGAITAKGRSIISISALTVEATLGGYFPKKYDALIYTIDEIIKEEYKFYGILFSNTINNIKNKGIKWNNEKERDTKLKRYLVEEVLNHIGVDENYYAYKGVVRKINKISIESLIKIYYKNNIGAFLNIDKVKDLFIRVLDTIDTNRAKNDDSVYVNPYEPPEPVKNDIDTLKNMTEEILCGYYWYGGDLITETNKITTNTQGTIKGIMRKMILLIDTDSNMIEIDELNNDINKIYNKGFTNLSKDEIWFTLSNLSTLIAISCVDYSLERYKDHTNVLEEYKSRINMKNEFLYRRFILTSRKKNYIGLNKLKEGNVFEVADLDIKGLSFTKSNFNQTLCGNVEDIVENDIMRSDNISLKHILKKLKNIDDEVLEMMKGETAQDFFDVHKLNGTFDDFPISDHRVTAIKLWNDLNLDDKIEAPATFYTAYLDLTDMEGLKRDYPKIFKKISYHIIDRMIEANEDKLNTYRIDISERLNFNYDELDFIGLKEKGKSGLMYRGEVEIRNGSVFLRISDNTALDYEIIDIITKKFNTKFRDKYDLYKTKKVVEMMENNIMVINDGNYLYLKINDIYNQGVKKTALDVLDIYTDTFRLISNKFMKRKGLEIKKKLLEKGTKEKEIKRFKLENLSSIQKSYKDIKKIALPYDITYIPDFILDFLNTTPVLTQTSNLIAPVIDPLGLVSLRDSKKRRHVTNVIDYY